MCRHVTCPFGAVGSVFAWERIGTFGCREHALAASLIAFLGAALCFLARKFLYIALLRYVDDMFAPER